MPWADAVRQAFLGAAAAVAGGSSGAILWDRDGERLVTAAADRPLRALGDLDAAATGIVLGGDPAELRASGQYLTALPMRLESLVVGALGVAGRQPQAAGDRPGLQALADCAALALEGSRRFAAEATNLERWTTVTPALSAVLGEAEHDLRTHVQVITGQLDLMAVTWPWSDLTARAAALGETEAACRLLLDQVLAILWQSRGWGPGNLAAVP